jgi:penicillin-binding protein 1A
MAARDRRRSAGRRLLAWTLRLVAYGTLFAVGAWFGLVVAAFPTLDDLERRASVRHVPGAILARDNTTVLRRLRAPRTRTYLEEADVPDVLADAVIAAEDRRFRQHSGIDVRGIARAARSDLQQRTAAEGGSTITQQLVKNTYVGPERSLARKSREAILAVALETRWSKQRILTTYLNTAYFGAGYYGVADAARGYFGVPVAKLTVAQAALLGGLLRAPETNSPYRAPALARRARVRVLDAMADLGTITTQQAVAAKRAAIPKPRTRQSSAAAKELAPHLSDVVVGDLIEHYGVNRALGGGLRVRTTIDAGLQRDANDALARVTDLGLDAALVSIDPRSGEVRAVAQAGKGAAGAFNVAFDGHRQPGSAFKPFMLAAAYEHGYAPGTVLLSAPFSKDYPGGAFRVTNGGGYAGNTTLERATWQSDNTVYARLQDRLGIESAIDVATAAGIRSRMDPVPALVLGALPQGTTPVELAHAYATFAAHGRRTSMVGTRGGPRYLSWVTEPGGDERWRPLATSRDAIDRGVADQVTATLEGVIARGTGTGAAIGRPAAGKTGTTEEYRDAWFVGYTPDLVTAVWVGHVRGGVPMATENAGGPVTGGSIPASIWRSFMTAALDGRAARDFDLEKPQYVTVSIDAGSGLLAGPWCAGAVEATFVKGKEPTETATGCVEHDRPLPDLVGRSLTDAKALLADEAFEVTPTVERRLVTGADRHGVVLSQSPAAGVRVFRDDPIELVVGDDPFSR